MSKKLEGTIMRNLGNKSSFKSKFLVILLLLPFYQIGNLSAQNYFINTYMSLDSINTEQYTVNTLKIDLESGSISNNLSVLETGTILNKLPYKIVRNTDTLLVTFSIDGIVAKNSSFSDNGNLLHLSICRILRNNMFNIVTRDFLNAKAILGEQQPTENSLRLALESDTSSDYILPPGMYTIGVDNNLNILNRASIDEVPGGIANLGGYSLLRKVWGADSYQLYHSFHNTQYWLVKLNDRLSAVIDSVQLRQTGGQATIYAYHPTQNKFYCFHLNYEMHGKFVNKNREDYYTNPEVLIYDPSTLRLLETRSIADYPEGNYPGKENGLADVVGDYIVYYFSQDDWMGIYAPAMLIIFDTRTNEATWLRVGWR
jgi:hypothetical protein